MGAFRFIAIMAALACATLAARAELGACKPDRFNVPVCGSGQGAARVIDDTASPDKRLAFAWRNPKGAPHEQPDTPEELQLLLLRLPDGAVLARGATEYWSTGETRVNRYTEEVRWSPDSRLALRALQLRFDTGALDVFAVGAGGKSATVHNLRKVIEPPLRKRVATRTNPAGSWSFLVVTDAPLRIDNAGRVRFRASMWLPKDGPSRDYDVVVQMTPGGPSAARVVSITTVKAP